MTDSPSQVSLKQLRDLYLEVKGKKPEPAAPAPVKQ
jgi:hypothetical protein